MNKSKIIEQNGKQLLSVKRVDLCRTTRVFSYLQDNSTIRAVITSSGNCFVVFSRNQRRLIHHLLGLVKQETGYAKELSVSPISFDNWQRLNQAKNSVDATLERGEENDKLKYVLDLSIEKQASDIYIDIGRRETRLAIRTFGYKRDLETFTREQGLALVRSMWANSSATFEETAPSDCSFSYLVESREYRIRGNSMPDIRGPSIVCRVRDPKFLLPLEESGYSVQQSELIKRICEIPGGLILISGETNSGKSTTLAALVNRLPKTQKIIEISDPVEVEMDHVTHVELNRYRKDAEEMYDRIQGAIVRQNPDTLVLGEIRDQKTAQAAMTMAIQGKRVFSTLHTQSCTAAIPRLENLGVTRDLLSLREFLVGVVNQNLTPLLCPKCALGIRPENPTYRRYLEYFGTTIRRTNPKGCNECSNGIIGQTLVAEVYPLGLDRSGRPHKMIQNLDFISLESYMREEWQIESKHQHACRKIRQGLIDPRETEKIIGEFRASDMTAMKPRLSRIQVAEKMPEDCQ